ncbi:MAG: glycosyltransferase [Microthrixaceae bacterium]
MSATPPAAKGEASRSAPMVGVVVLNWNAAWFTRRCIDSLGATTHPRDRLRIVLVDNGSVDGSREELKQWLTHPGTPEVELVENDSNLGFAEGCNRGIRELLDGPGERPEWIALLNNDATCEPGWIDRMLAVVGERTDVGAVASRLLLDPAFVPVDVGPAYSDLTLVSAFASVSGGRPLEVTGAVRASSEWNDQGALQWPAGRLWQLPEGERGTLWVPCGEPGGQVEARLVDESGAEVLLRSSGAEAEVLRNGLGTGLNESVEGFDIGYGELDGSLRDRTSRPVDGFCGGAALLNSDALEEVGLFDPHYFAYYEDTDLSWRMRRSGRVVLTAPDAVVHHAFGASGGGGSRLHVFLDRRNWLTTVFRNGDAADLRHALAWLRRGMWRLFRVNVFGRLRRGSAAQWQPLATWTSAVVSAIARWPRARRSRGVGRRPTDRVRSIGQPRSGVPEPKRRPGGPLLVYVDVGETLKAGYRAGIQRVVCGLVAELPTAAPGIEMVLIRWCERNSAYRRITSDEYESLLRSGAAIPAAVGPAEHARSALRGALGALGVISLVRSGREWVFGRTRRAIEDDLVLAGIPGEAVLFELDAVWNETQVDRAALLGALRGRGVHVATFVHDLFPLEHPEWFAPALRRIFDPTVEAQLAHSELLLCASEETEAQIRRHVDPDRTDVEVARMPLGADPIGAREGGLDGANDALPAGLGNPGVDYLLVVGTVETRKNHALALDLFEALAPDHRNLHLVVVGRYGWGAESELRRLEGTRSGRVGGNDARLHWFPDAGDAVLESLYSRAHTVLVPSLAEGFGLPVVEALLRGVPVVASDSAGLRQAGGDAAFYLDPADLQAWVGEMSHRLTDPGYHDSMVASARGFDPPSWLQAAHAARDALLTCFGPKTDVTYPQ